MDQLPDLDWGRTETPTPVNALGARGVGEAGIACALPAVVNAVIDALDLPAIANLDPPLTPERLWRCLSDSPGEEEESLE